MKILNNNISVLALIGIVSLWLCSCNKSESPYYNYENKVQTYNGTALEYLKAQPDGTFDSLLLVLKRFPNLEDSLTNQEVTLFAPVNKNFESAVKYLNIQRKMYGLSNVYLADANQAELDTMICKYIVRGKKTTDAYLEDLDGVLVKSIVFDYPMHVRYAKMSSSGFVEGGASILNFSETFGSTFKKDWVTTKANTVNIRTNNATINILDPIHNFGFDEFTRRLFLNEEK
ncbi:hypothetical protein [Sphingobacterium anhuiense]|uniref:FAS1 domain-containing protein n=1 Tax=Sphingobacterium anhuiense TaxID=493780 RepID=A0ABW5Z2I5_9SPHI